MNDDDLDEYELRERLNQARNSYQRLYNQHQQELAAIAQWQTRMTAENETLRDHIYVYNDRLAGYISERFPNIPIGVYSDRDMGVIEGLSIAQSILRTILTEGK